MIIAKPQTTQVSHVLIHQIYKLSLITNMYTYIYIIYIYNVQNVALNKFYTFFWQVSQYLDIFNSLINS